MFHLGRMWAWKMQLLSCLIGEQFGNPIGVKKLPVRPNVPLRKNVGLEDATSIVNLDVFAQKEST